VVSEEGRGTEFLIVLPVVMCPPGMVAGSGSFMNTSMSAEMSLSGGDKADRQDRVSDAVPSTATTKSPPEEQDPESLEILAIPRRERKPIILIGACGGGISCAVCVRLCTCTHTHMCKSPLLLPARADAMRAVDDDRSSRLVLSKVLTGLFSVEVVQLTDGKDVSRRGASFAPPHAPNAVCARRSR
jgi:hypothetical protein